MFSLVISVLSFWFSPFDDRGKESIRPMLRRKSPKEAVRANNALCAHGFLQEALDGAPWIGDLESVSQRAQHFADNEFILLRFERTSGIHQPPARRQMRKRVSQQARLAFMQIAKIFGAELPSNLRVPGERARAGAGNIDQNAFERAFEWKRLRSVQDDRLHVSNAGEFESLLHGAHAILVQIRGDHVALRSGRAREEQGLAARRRA